MSLSESIVQLRQNLDDCETYVKSLESGRKSSSAKARSNLMKIKKQSHDLRKKITEHTKSLPTKARSKKEPTIVAEVATEAVVEDEVKPTEAVEVAAVAPAKRIRKPKSKKITTS